MSFYLLDTNIASMVIKDSSPSLRARILSLQSDDILMISVVTEAELRFGVAKRGSPKGLSERVEAFLERVAIMPWTPVISPVYAEMRTSCEAAGVTLGALDMMIAAHAKSLGATLVSDDGIFRRIPGAFPIENWHQN